MTACHAIDLEQLMRSHRNVVARALRRAGVAERDLPDLMQEVFIVAHRRLPQWEGRSKPSTWLYRIAFRVASDHRRRAYQRHERLTGAEDLPPSAATTELPELERREQLLQLCAALEQLSEAHKKTLLGYELEELSVAELAARTRVPHKTVYSRLHAARRHLRQLLLAQGWTLLGCVLWLPRRCLAAVRAFAGAWLAHAPLACILLLLTPTAPQAPTVTSPRPAVEKQSFASARPPTATTPQPSAAATPKPKRAARKRPVQAAPPPTEPPPTPSLIVIHVGSVERPERDLPFGFERIPKPTAHRITLHGPRDPVDVLERELMR